LTSRRIDWRDDRGQVAGIEAIPFGILLFVVGALLVANAWAVLDAKMATDSAAREAARTYVEAPDHDTGLFDATAAARDAIDGQGRDPDRLELRGPATADEFARCNRVTFRATYVVPAIALPMIGGFGNGITVTSSHSELVDPFRDGVGGEAVCGG
jgi:hypothetical protein